MTDALHNLGSYAGLLCENPNPERGVLEEIFEKHKGLLIPKIRLYIPESIEEKGFYEEITLENNSGLVCETLWYLVETGEPPLKLDIAGYFSESYAKKLEMVWREYQKDSELRKKISKKSLTELINRYLKKGLHKKPGGAVYGFKFAKKIHRHCCFPITKIEPSFQD